MNPTLRISPGSETSQAKVRGFLNTLRKDAKAAVIVFLVALPLCLAIAKASGMPPAAGLITGIIGGILVGLISGSPLQVSGPAAGLIVLTKQIVDDHGASGLAAVLLIAAVMQIAGGFLKLGQWFRAASPAVIEGMLAGIGVLILANQFHVMIDDPARKSGLDNLATIPASLWNVVHPAADIQNGRGWIGLLTLAAMIAWKSLLPTKIQIIPAALVAVLIGSALASMGGFSINRIDVPDDLWQAVHLPDAATWTLLLHTKIWASAVSVGLIASAETLLCATAVDQMHQGARTRFNKELSAQGLGNLICGIVGSLPMTGVIVRSSANVAAGAKSRYSAVMHGVFLLLLVMFVPGLLKMIPTACLAGILVYTGFKLINFKEARHLYKDSRAEFLIFLATMMVIVVTDLLTGVIIGVILSAIKLLYTLSHMNVCHEEQPERKRTLLHLVGSATFLRLPILAASLEQVRPNSELHIQMDRLDYIDHACLGLLMNWEKQHRANGGSLVIDWERLRAKFHAPRSQLSVGSPTVRSALL